MHKSGTLLLIFDRQPSHSIASSLAHYSSLHKQISDDYVPASSRYKSMQFASYMSWRIQNRHGDYHIQQLTTRNKRAKQGQKAAQHSAGL
jgi:hypothetical protein